MYTGPNIKTRDLVISIDAINSKSYKKDYNFIDTSLWANGQTGGVSMTLSYSSNNRRSIGVDPWGNEIIVWESFSVEGSGSGGGIYVKPLLVDHSKMYRVSFWEKRISNSDATIARYYLGCNIYGSVNGALRRVTGANLTTNPYFWYTNLPVFNNDWYLVVGHIWPSESGAGLNHEDSGLYDVNGRVGSITTDYVMLPETTSLRSRTLSVHSPNAGGVLHHSSYPRIDVCDGNEPTIDELLSGRMQTWRSFNGYNLKISDAKWNPVGFFSFRGQGDSNGVIEGDNIGGFEDVADTRLYNKGMSVSWWMRLSEFPAPKQCLFFGGESANHIELENLNSSNPSFKTKAAIQNNYSFGTGAIPGGSLVGKWVNFTVVFDFMSSPRSVKWYKDGKVFYVHNNFDSGASGSNEFFMFSKFGRSSGSADHSHANSFKGDLAMISVYRSPLNSKEVFDNYLAFKNRFK